jgi:hypothetical protein
MRPLPHLTATSAADPSRQSSANITITSNFTLQIAAPANLAPGVTSATVATMTPVPGSRARRRKCPMHLWSTPGPVQFDGNYEIDRLPVGRSYNVYAGPLGGAVAPSEVSNALITLCRNATTGHRVHHAYAAWNLPFTKIAVRLGKASALKA